MTKEYQKMSLDEIAWEAGVKGLDWAQKKQISDRLERGKPSKLAELELVAIRKSTHIKISKADAEMQALASDEYKDFLNDWDVASGESLRAKVIYDTWTNLFEARRTLESTRREEMKMR